MKILKSDGTLQEFNPNKILNRIKKASKGLKVDYEDIFKSVISEIKEGMSTKDIDESIAYGAADKIIEHPDYSKLGGRVLVSSWAKYLEQDLKPVDENYNFFSAYTFFEKYAKRDGNGNPTEIPSVMYQRVANHLHSEDADRAELLEELYSKKLNFASPIYTNSGVEGRNALISCNLTVLKNDSLDGIEETKLMIAKASKEGSGLGLLIDPLRSRHTLVKSFKYKAGGVIRFADMIQSTMRFYKQGNRSGSCALYMSLWHRDILDFLELRLPIGEEQNRARDLFYGVVVNDLFMKKLIANESWYLFCPEILRQNGIKPFQDLWGEEFEKEYQKAVDLGIGYEIQPSKIIEALIKAQVESGNPYVFFKDNANKGNMQDNIGTISFSNLCVSGDTKILTYNGYTPIEDLEDTTVDVWNGSEWSEVDIVKTGVNQQLLEVKTDSGHTIKATPYHKWYVQEEFSNSKVIEKRTHELNVNDKLIKFELPVIDGQKELKYAYTQGFFSGDGFCEKNDVVKSKIYLYGEKRDLLPYIDRRVKIYQSSSKTKEDAILEQEGCNRISVHVPLDIINNKSFVPGAEYTIKSRLNWFAGLLDSDGTLTDLNSSQTFQICSTNKPFLHEVQLMLQTLGCVSKVTFSRESGVHRLPANDGTGSYKLYKCKEINRLLVNGNFVYNLVKLGLETKRLKPSGKKPNRECSVFTKIKSVDVLPDLYNTYCANEPKRNRLMFNGILTGNCSEILSVSKPGYTSQCTLGSINLAEQESIESVGKTVRVLVKALNKVIDKNKWSDEWSEKAGIDQRSIAIGVAGLADFFAKRQISFESQEAKDWQEAISEVMYKEAVKESNRLAEESGENYPSWEGSKYQRGITYVDGWSPKPQGEPIPMKNSLLIGLMPTASSAILLGAFESFEPVTSNFFTRRVGQGEYLVVNEHLVKDLEKIGLWNEDMRDRIIANRGSVQTIMEIPQKLRDVYKDVWEIPQKTLLDLSAIRNKYVDHSQSLNVYHSGAEFNKILSALVYAWKIGLKTGVYYTRTKSKLQGSTDMAVSKVETKKSNYFECDGCSA